MPEDPETAAELQAQINALALPQLHGKAPEKTKIITAEMQENPMGIHRVRLELFPSVCKAVFETQKGCRIIRAGWGNAIEDLALLNGKESRPTPCSATAEQQGNDLRIKAWFYETPFCTDFTFTEKEGVLTVREEQNLYFLTEPAPEICGRILKDKND